MAKGLELVDALKRALKQRGVTYRDLAERLGLSEASIKRLFAQRSFTLQRFDSVCEVVGIDLSDLVEEAAQARLIRTLSPELEQELVSDPRLLLVAVLVMQRWTFSNILDVYNVDVPELTRLLARLDRMHLIELQPANRIKLLVSPDFSWRRGGAIQRYFEKQVQSEFFACSFQHPGELRLFTSGMLSRTSNTIIQQRMERLAQEFRQAHLDDQKLPISERFGTSLVIAIRPWELPVFETLRRPGTEKTF